MAMPETLEQIPPEAWPLIDLMFNLTLAAAGIWLAIVAFVIWRRHASNLTPVLSPSKKDSAQPDFLKVDKEARKDAIARGEKYDRELARQEQEEAEGKQKPPLAQRIASAVTFFMSLFTLATMLLGAVTQVTRMGEVMTQYSTSERLMAVVREHPIGITVVVLVIISQIYLYFTNRKWKES
jgi:hypothetical protein